MLSAEDNSDGSGLASTSNRIHNNTIFSNSTGYDSRWLTYAGPFNLTSLSDGNYTIAFNSTDNAGNIENMNVTLVGPDINGDGTVGMKDIAIAAKSFGSYPGHPRWNPIADINLDGRVDLQDIALVARMFGKQYPSFRFSLIVSRYSRNLD